MTREERIQRLLDKDDIETALQTWSTGVARKDWDKVRSVFHAQATDAHGVFDGGVDQMLQWQQRHHQGVVQSVHFVGGVQIEFAGPDLALSEAYVIAFHRYGKDATQARLDIFGPQAEDQVKPLLSQIVGRYIDRFERRDGMWKIAKRVTAFEWIRLEDAPWQIPFQPGWQSAQGDRSDPIYAMRRELNLPE